MKIFTVFNKKVLISYKKKSEMYLHSMMTVSLKLNMVLFAGQQQVRTMAAGSVTPVFTVFGQVLYWRLSNTCCNVNTQLRSDCLTYWVQRTVRKIMIYFIVFLEELYNVLLKDIYKEKPFKRITFNDSWILLNTNFLKGVFVDFVRTCARLFCISIFFSVSHLLLYFFLYSITISIVNENTTSNPFRVKTYFLHHLEARVGTFSDGFSLIIHSHQHI